MTNIEIRIHGIYDDLSNAEKKVATYFLENLNSIYSTPIATLARESGVSQVAWVRFCKSIGFAGLKDLKRSFFEEINGSFGEEPLDAEQMYADIKNYTSVEQIVSIVRQSSIQAIDDTSKILDTKLLEKAAQIIADSNSVKLFGVGASALVAEDLFNKLLRIGKHTSFCRDNHIQLTYAANTAQNDVAIFISNSGFTSEIIELMEIVSKSGCYTIAITRFGKSPLAHVASIVLNTTSPEIYRRSGAMSSRIAQLIVVDTLFTCIANRNYQQVENCLEKSYQSCNRHKLKIEPIK